MPSPDNMKTSFKTIAQGFIGGLIAIICIAGGAKAAQDIWSRGFNNYAVPTNNVAIAQYMTNPFQPTGTATTTGGTLVTATSTTAAPTWYFKIEAVDLQGGVTQPSPETAVTLATSTGATSSVALSWGSVPGAASYRVYYGTTTGGENTYQTTSVASLTFATTTGTGGTLPSTLSTAYANVIDPNGNSRLAGNLTSGGSIVQNNPSGVNSFAGFTVEANTLLGGNCVPTFFTTTTVLSAGQFVGVCTLATFTSTSTATGTIFFPNATAINQVIPLVNGGVELQWVWNNASSALQEVASSGELFFFPQGTGANATGTTSSTFIIPAGDIGITNGMDLNGTSTFAFMAQLLIP